MAKILLIDDDDLFRDMLGKTLAKMGHEVTEATNGRQGLQLYIAARSDLVLTDLIMPEREGLETIEDLRKVDPKVRIIAMSGGGRINAKDFLRIARYMGAGRTLAKPFSTEELAAAIADLLPPTSTEQKMTSGEQGTQSDL